MASNTPTLMQSEEKELERITSEDIPTEKDYTISICISKYISTFNIDSYVDNIKRYLAHTGWDIDNIEYIKE